MDDERELHPSEQPMASEVADRVRDVIASAEAAASAMRREANDEAETRKRVAEQEARNYLEDARRQAEAYLNTRVERISELSSAIMERAEAVLSRLDRADEVKRQLQSLADALGETAERMVRDAREVGLVEEAATGEPEPESLPETPPEPAAEPKQPLRVAPEAEPVEVPPREPEPPAEPETPAATGPGPSAAEGPAGAPLNPVTDHASEAASEEQSSDGGLLVARLVALQMAVAGGNRGEVEAHLRRAFELDDPTSILDDVFGRGTDEKKRVVWPHAMEN
jgi:vacuolar-type H+-ATPase subunit H